MIFAPLLAYRLTITHFYPQNYTFAHYRNSLRALQGKKQEKHRFELEITVFSGG